MAGALDDVRIIDASGPIGHYAGRLLADLGADVIKLEPPGGDPARGYPPLLPDVDPPEGGLQFLLLNANKRGVTLDLTRPEGFDLFRRLLSTADVLLDSWQPQEARALGITDELLGAARPDLIRASVTGWGLSGPRAEWAYADIVGAAMSGMMTLAGFVDGPPEQPPDLQGFHSASINAAAGVVAALLHRDESGEGQLVEVSMQEALSMSQETAMQQADILGTDRQRIGTRGGPDAPGMGLYECADGHVYLMGGIAGRGFDGLIEVIEEAGEGRELRDGPLASFIEEIYLVPDAPARTDPERADEIRQRTAELNDWVTGFMRRHPKRWLYEQGQQRLLLIGMVSTPEDVSTDPQLAARDWFVEIDDPGRGMRLRYPGPPWQLHGTPATLRRPAPLLGEHNDEVFGELGVDGSELGALTKAGVV